MKTFLILFFSGLFQFVNIHASLIIVRTAEHPTIQAGIDSATAGDSVLVQPGTYLENINFKGKNIILGSLFLTTGDTTYISQTIINGSQDGTVVNFTSGEDSTTLLIGFLIRNGMHHPGGGIYIKNSDPIISNCILIDNIAESSNGIGGGIYLENSTSKLYKNRIFNNSALGMDANNGWGGGIGCYSSDIELINCKINNNYATSASGGVGIIESYIKILGCEISNNSVGSSGAGLSFQDSYPILINSTITNNSSNLHGGGFYYIRSDPLILNSIIWYNKANSGSQNINGWGGVVDITYSNIQGGYMGTGNIDLNPLFADTTNADFRLSSYSPCIDSGIPDTTGLNLPPWDLDRNYRICDGDENGSEIIDMGAYEYGSKPFVSINENLIVNMMNFRLYQNYPNPFNPTTVISWQLAVSNYVELSVYNILGQRVAKLISGKQKAGFHEVEWDASGFSSGIYFYKLETENGFVESRKLIILK